MSEGDHKSQEERETTSERGKKCSESHRVRGENKKVSPSLRDNVSETDNIVRKKERSRTTSETGSKSETGQQGRASVRARKGEEEPSCEGENERLGQ